MTLNMEIFHTFTAGLLDSLIIFIWQLINSSVYIYFKNCMLITVTSDFIFVCGHNFRVCNLNFRCHLPALPSLNRTLEAKRSSAAHTAPPGSLDQSY